MIELTDDTFDKNVLDSEDVWMVEFYAPWCGHCKNLEPEWAAAATEVKEQTKGKVKLAAVDATVNQVLASRYGIRGFPTIKIFQKGESPVDYDGGGRGPTSLPGLLICFRITPRPLSCSRSSARTSPRSRARSTSSAWWPCCRIFSTRELQAEILTWKFF